LKRLIFHINAVLSILPRFPQAFPDVSRAANHHIRVISEGSDSEDWSNDAENSDLITGINYIVQYTHIKQLF